MKLNEQVKVFITRRWTVTGYKVTGYKNTIQRIEGRGFILSKRNVKFRAGDEVSDETVDDDLSIYDLTVEAK